MRLLLRMRRKPKNLRKAKRPNRERIKIKIRRRK